MKQIRNLAKNAFIALVALCAFALSAGVESWAQQEPAQAAAQKNKNTRHMMVNVEERIEALHKDLQINPPQEPAFKEFAAVMREKSMSMKEMLEKRAQQRQSGTMTAVDEMKSHTAMAEEHYQYLRKVTEAFEPLYKSMSPEQKKNADKVFSRNEREAHKRRPKAQ